MKYSVSELIRYLRQSGYVVMRKQPAWKKFEVHQCERDEIKHFVKHWDYMHKLNGVKSSYCFKLIYNDDIVGAIIYGQFAMSNSRKVYGGNSLEMRRFCTISSLPSSIKSYFIQDTLRWLKKYTDVETVVCYINFEHGHMGMLFKTAQFEYDRTTHKDRLIEYNGRQYHDRSLRASYKGRLKPYAVRLRNALSSGTANYMPIPGKYVYKCNLQTKEMS